MTIKKRLARSNLVMLVVPVLTAGVLLVIGLGLALFLLQTVYLPRMGLSLWELHQTGEQIETLLSGLETFACVYAGALFAALLLSIALTNLYLTRNIFRHISEPLDALTAGVARIQDGDLDSPIAYPEPDEFRSACDAVDEMAARLKASLEQQQLEQQKKQELIAGMSHDLKSPLTSIRAYTEALLDGVAKDDAAKQRYLQTIHTKEAEIEAMVNRLFAFAKMDASAYPTHTEALPLLPLMQELTEEWETEGLEIQTEISPDLRVLADRELLSRITANLLGNSRKYGGRETVHVRISAGRTGNLVEIAFSDDGPGVPPEQLSKLFDVFYRGDAARTAPGEGSGLGLAVVKKAVTEMGGDVHAENEENGGLKILFTLPAAKEDSHAEHTDY